MDNNAKNAKLYTAIARNLRDFGYPTDAREIAEVDKAMRDGEELPHGIVGMFARDQLKEARDGHV